MMRYCAASHGAVGFVVSQDGDVRAIIGDRGVVVFWENMAVHRHPARRRSRISAAERGRQSEAGDE
jgi:formylmethanofuran dehydrogenase subunit B